MGRLLVSMRLLRVPSIHQCHKHCLKRLVDIASHMAVACTLIDLIQNVSDLVLVCPWSMDIMTYNICLNDYSLPSMLNRVAFCVTGFCA